TEAIRCCAERRPVPTGPPLSRFLSVQRGDEIGIIVDAILDFFASQLDPVSLEAFPAGGCVDLIVERAAPLETGLGSRIYVWQCGNLQTLGNRFVVHALQLVGAGQHPSRPRIVGLHLKHTAKLSEGLVVASGGQESDSGALGNIERQWIQLASPMHFLETLLRSP